MEGVSGEIYGSCSSFMGKEGESKARVSQEEELILTPWEQHSAVISIPRFDYRAPNWLLKRPYSGFLITCPIKREKSATKEAIFILEKHIVCSTDAESVESFDAHAEKKRKINSEDTERECSHSSNGKDGLNNVENHDVAGRLNLSLVKLRKNGLLLFTYPCDNSQKSVDVFVKVLRSLELGNLKPPQWCHRILPIQETCMLKEIDIFNVVIKLVQKCIDNNVKKVEMPTKFAVGYDRRGFDERNGNSLKSTKKDIHELDLLDRNECFKVVAKAVKHVVVESIVDLKSPELIILIELLPISGVPNDSIVAGVSVLPHELVSTKPRLCVKPLISDMKKKHHDFSF